MTEELKSHGNAAVLLLAIVIIGVLLTWWEVARVDGKMRSDLLLQTRMVAQAVNIDRLMALSGSANDQANPDYLRLKDQLTTIRTSIPSSRFVYLLGRNTDDKLFFFLDSEPVTSADFSPPGQIYGEAPEGFQMAFSTHKESMVGPYTDRWGTWVTALVPIHDPRTALTGIASPEKARKLVGKAAEFYQKHGRERFMREMNNPQGEFRQGDLYAFAYDHTMTMMAHPVKPELVGQNLLNKKDWSGGKFFRKEIQEVVRTKGSGWVDYEYENPANKQREPKTTYAQGVDDLIICAGAYKGGGALLAVMAMDIDAKDWQWMLARAALPTILLTLALVSLVIVGRWLLLRRARLGGLTTHTLVRHLEAALAVAAGLIVTLYVTRMVYKREVTVRNETFVQLAASRTEAIAEVLRDLRATGLEGLSHFFENNAVVTRDNFSQFTTYLTRNLAVLAWEWAPAVPEDEKPHFEEDVRATGGVAGFAIWQKDGQGKNSRSLVVMSIIPSAWLHLCLATKAPWGTT